MNLVELIVDLENKRNKRDAAAIFHLSGPSLKNFEKQLFECDEFKNVVRINFIDLPSYLVDEETGEPISSQREFLGGKTSHKDVITFKIKPDEKIVFNKVVDLYSVQVLKIFNTNETISKPGVWIYPTTYNDKFEPLNEIRILWNPEQLQEVLNILSVSKETPKERLKRMFDEALDKMEPNLSCSYVLMVRCSERSTDAKADEGLISGTPVVESQIPPVQGINGGFMTVN